MKKGTISSRQTAIIASLLMFANKILVLPSLLYELSKVDAFFAMIFLLAFEFAIIFLFFRIKRFNPDKTFYEVIQSKLGTFMAKVFYSLLILYFFYKIMLLFNVSFMYFRMQVYLESSYYIFIFAFMLIMNTSVLRGLRPLARCMEFFYFFILTAFVFCLILSVGNFDTFPTFFDSNISSFFSSMFRYSFCFGDMLLLLMIMDKVELDKQGEKKVLKFSLVSASLILILYFLFFSIFDYTSFLHKNALSDIITFSYRFTDLGRLDIVAIMTVMFLSYFQLSLYAYAFSECFVKLFSKLSVAYSVVVFDIIFVVVILSSVIDYLIAIEIGILVIPYFAILLHLILPAVCAINLKKRRKHETSLPDN